MVDPAVHTAVNLRTGEKRTYIGLTQSEAVIAAYAQEHGDWNTWDYGQHKYQVTWGKSTVACGDWTVKL